MALDSCGQNPFSSFWKRPNQGAADSRVQRLLEPIEKKFGSTSFLDMDQWHELIIRLMVRANPYKLVTHYDAVPEAGGQKASWQLPHDMTILWLGHNLLGVTDQLWERGRESPWIGCTNHGAVVAATCLHVIVFLMKFQA